MNKSYSCSGIGPPAQITVGLEVHLVCHRISGSKIKNSSKAEKFTSSHCFQTQTLIISMQVMQLERFVSFFCLNLRISRGGFPFTQSVVTQME